MLVVIHVRRCETDENRHVLSRALFLPSVRPKKEHEKQ